MLRGTPVLAVVVVATLPLATSPAGRAHTTPQHRTVTIQISGVAFVPASVEVQRGDTVRFVQTTYTTHNVEFTFVPAGTRFADSATTSAGAVTGNPPRRRGPPLRRPGDAYNLIIADAFRPGAHHYTCVNHEHKGMVGVIVVRQ